MGTVYPLYMSHLPAYSHLSDISVTYESVSDSETGDGREAV